MGGVPSTEDVDRESGVGSHRRAGNVVSLPQGVAYAEETGPSPVVVQTFTSRV